MQVISQNKKARFLYEIIKVYEAGIVLLGSEVKSIRQNNVNINDSFIKTIKEELFLINTNISIYKESSYQNHEPTRTRKLLLHKAEIRKIIPKIKEKNLTMIPLKLYLNPKGKVKLEIALVKGKKLHDKRQSLKEKDLQKQSQKTIKNLTFSS